MLLIHQVIRQLVNRLMLLIRQRVQSHENDAKRMQTTATNLQRNTNKLITCDTIATKPTDVIYCRQIQSITDQCYFSD